MHRAFRTVPTARKRTTTGIHNTGRSSRLEWGACQLVGCVYIRTADRWFDPRRQPTAGTSRFQADTVTTGWGGRGGADGGLQRGAVVSSGVPGPRPPAGPSARIAGSESAFRPPGDPC
jgi:hypothetical protein